MDQQTIDQLVRLAGVGGLILGILNLLLTWYLWSRTGPRLKVSLREEQHTDPTQGALIIEVASTGRIPVVVRAIGIRDQIPGSPRASQLSLESAPLEGVKLPAEIAPTNFIIASIPTVQVGERWDPGRKLTLVAWAVTGSGQRFESSPLAIETPPAAD